MPSTAIMWFRRDLRLADLPALNAAHADHADVVGLFVVDPTFSVAGRARLDALRQALSSLSASMHGQLVIRFGSPSTVVPALAAEVGAAAVYVSRDFAPYGRQRDGEVSRGLRDVGSRLVGVGSPYAVAPGSVTKDDGTPYRVFTPFARAWRRHGWDAPAAAGSVSWRAAGGDGLDSLERLRAHSGAAPITTRRVDSRVGALVDALSGEPSAWHRWEVFRAGPLDAYDGQRDLPAVDGTSRLSAALRWGTIHPRQLLAELAPHGDSRAHDVFASELAWREFYADVLHHRPDTARHNVNRAMAAMPVDDGPTADLRFAAWQMGMTGYPIVDAGMRQLAATGWMHNRVRMLVASFLTKDLHLPWQWGARHFMRHLVDGDLASNSHGWQWTAGTGTDASPYFRIFNPTTQSERFDPSGEYIRRWVPELASVDDRSVHAPGPLQRGDYPMPIVDHAVERDESLRRYRTTVGQQADSGSTR